MLVSPFVTQQRLEMMKTCCSKSMASILQQQKRNTTRSAAPKYVSKSNLQYQEKKEDNSDGDLYTKAFGKMVVDIQSGIAAGKAYDMTSLLSWYQSLLLECGIDMGKSYRSERLKNRLKLHFENNIVFHKQPDPSKPEIVYSSRISLQDVINNASSMSVESSRA